MLYLVDSELEEFAPQVTIPSAVTKRRALIQKASGKVDGVVGRARWGLGVTAHYNQQIALDLNYTGELPNTPFVEWISTTGELITVGVGSLTTQFTLSDFDVDRDAGIIKSTRMMFGGSGFTRSEPRSPFREVSSPYHQGTYNQIDGNPYPYQLTASFRAGFFLTTGVAASGTTGDSSVSVSVSVGRFISPGDQFYFDTDPENEPMVDTRYVTEVNGSLISFEPALGYALPAMAHFRKIDLNVRRACGIIVSDLIQFPQSTSQFSKDLGRRALAKSWKRNNEYSVPTEAMELLSAYRF